MATCMPCRRACCSRRRFSAASFAFCARTSSGSAHGSQAKKLELEFLTGVANALPSEDIGGGEYSARAEGASAGSANGS
eukprot:CAMPEP_0169129882 /NCGR_PEP_ID=MMETSP1015-20121227/37386_1 /TAXON_ID=342587 /ORGANISM="Karlodinium micrum, Strain CCMP2283" /LENGTH=78 /DNA_ID=CAMNT_0009193977 /DNA_START=371 /DNA_END=603 /DNA_ORIENTATION=+